MVADILGGRAMAASSTSIDESADEQKTVSFRRKGKCESTGEVRFNIG